MSSEGQEFRKEQNLVIIFITAAVFVFLPLIMTGSYSCGHHLDTQTGSLGSRNSERSGEGKKKSKAGKNRQKGKRI